MDAFKLCMNTFEHVHTNTVQIQIDMDAFEVCMNAFEACMNACEVCMDTYQVHGDAFGVRMDTPEVHRIEYTSTIFDANWADHSSARSSDSN